MKAHGPTPATAPNSPATARSNRYVVPVTPKRISVPTTKSFTLPQNQHRRSPRTPLSTSSSPYTPLSTRSSNYSYASSNVTTPGSAYSAAGPKRLTFGTRGEDVAEGSLADIT